MLAHLQCTNWGLFNDIAPQLANSYQKILEESKGDFYQAQKKLFETSKPDIAVVQNTEENDLDLLTKWIETLSFNNAGEQEEFLDKVFTRFPELKCLKLPACLLNDSAFHAIFMKPLQLQKLALKEFHNITKIGLINLIRYIPTLEIVLGDKHRLTNLEFSEIVRTMWDLKGSIAIQLDDEEIPLEQAKLNQHLIKVLQKQHLFYAKVLLSLGANVHQRNESNETLLHSCAGIDCPAVLQFLIDQHVPLEAIEKKFKRTALHIAAAAGCMGNINILAINPILDKSDGNGFTALHRAVMCRKVDAAFVLLSRGANLNTVNERNETICHLAIQYNLRDFFIQLLRDYPTARNLLEIAEKEDGRTPLHFAVWGPEKTDIVRIILEYDAKVDTRNPWGFTALHWAAKHGHKQSAQLLLEKGANRDAVNKLGATPIDLAIKHGQDEMILYFLGVTAKISPCPAEDVEGYYYRCLVQAKAEGKIAEQVLYLERLGDYFLNKKEFSRSAKLFNCALAVLQKDNNPNPILEKYLFGKIERVEALFTDNLNLKVPPTNRKMFLTFREMLKDIRRRSLEVHQNNHGRGEITTAFLTEHYIRLLRLIITDAQYLLGQPTVNWVCIGMGSMSKTKCVLIPMLNLPLYSNKKPRMP